MPSAVPPSFGVCRTLVTDGPGAPLAIGAARYRWRSAPEPTGSRRLVGARRSVRRLPGPFPAARRSGSHQPPDLCVDARRVLVPFTARIRDVSRMVAGWVPTVKRARSPRPDRSGSSTSTCTRPGSARRRFAARTRLDLVMHSPGVSSATDRARRAHEPRQTPARLHEDGEVDGHRGPGSRPGPYRGSMTRSPPGARDSYPGHARTGRAGYRRVRRLQHRPFAQQERRPTLRADNPPVLTRPAQTRHHVRPTVTQGIAAMDVRRPGAVAERVGFEPTNSFESALFKSAAINRSATSPRGRGYPRLRRRSGRGRALITTVPAMRSCQPRLRLSMKIQM